MPWRRNNQPLWVVGLLLILSLSYSCTSRRSGSALLRQQSIDLISQGEKWEEAGKLLPAINCYVKAIELSARPRAYYRVANCYVKLNEFDRAKLYLTQALSLAPEYKQAELLLAELEAETRASTIPELNYQPLTGTSAQSLQLPPPSSDTSSPTLRQDSALSPTNPSEGLPSVEEVKKVLFPRLYTSGKEEDRFWETINKKKAILLGGAEYHKAKAQMFADRGLLPEAEAEFKEALRIDATDLDSWLGLAEIYIEQKRLKTAEKTYNKIIDLFPGDWQAYFARGNLYLKIRQYKKAVQDLHSVVRLAPGNVKALNNLAVAYLNLGNHQQACTLLNKAIELDPQFPDPYINLGIIYEKYLKKPDEARVFFQNYIDFKGDRAEEVKNWLKR